MDAIFTKGLVQAVQSVLDQANRSGERVSAWDEIQDLLLKQKVAPARAPGRAETPGSWERPSESPCESLCESPGDSHWESVFDLKPLAGGGQREKSPV